MMEPERVTEMSKEKTSQTQSEAKASRRHKADSMATRLDATLESLGTERYSFHVSALFEALSNCAQLWIVAFKNVGRFFDERIGETFEPRLSTT